MFRICCNFTILNKKKKKEIKDSNFKNISPFVFLILLRQIAIKLEKNINK